MFTASAVFGQSARQKPSTAAAPAAEALLSRAAAKAAAESKNVFVVFGASWCPPCRELDAFLNSPDTSKVVARQYVLLHLTIWENGEKVILNNPGAEILFQRLGGEDSIPFVAFIDGSGRTIASGNLGAPDKSAERRKLMALFDRTAPNMSAEERSAVLRDLRNGLGAIAGRVTDHLGKPVAKAAVSIVTGSSNAGGQWTPVWGPRTETDDDGRYAFEDVAPGDHRVLVEAGTRSGVTQLNLRPRYEQTGVDVRVDLIRRAELSGVATGANGKPIAHGSVALIDLDRPARAHHAATGADGAFAVREVQPGRYNLWVRSTESSQLKPLGEAGLQPVLVIGSDIAGLNIHTKKSATLSGAVSWQGGSMSAVERRAVGVAAVGMPVEAGAPDASARLQADGHFQIRGVYGSRVIRVTNLPRSWSLQTVRLNGEDITDKAIDFSGMGSLGGIEVVIKRAGRNSGKF